MAYKEDEYLMLSGIRIQILPTAMAIDHIEQQWSENVQYIMGELMHKKVHDPSVKEKKKETLLVRRFPGSPRKSLELVGNVTW